MSTQPPDHPARNATVESWLDDHAVLWEFVPDLALDRVDVARSRQNQARVGEPIIDDLADRYAAAMKRGDQFPAVLAHRPTRRARKLVLLGGNHRHEAATRAGVAALPAYVVECEPETAIVLTYEDNARHGLPPNTQERIRQAIHLIGLGWTAEHAAAAVGVTAPQVSVARKAAEGSRRARDLEVPGFDTIVSEGKRAELARIQSDAVFEAATRLTVRANLSSQAVLDLSKRIRAARSEEQALKIIGDEMEERRHAIQQAAGGKAPKARRTAWGTLNGALAQVADLSPAAVRDTVPTPAAASSLRKRIADAMVQLNEIREAIR